MGPRYIGTASPVPGLEGDSETGTRMVEEANDASSPPNQESEIKTDGEVPASLLLMAGLGSSELAASEPPVAVAVAEPLPSSTRFSSDKVVYDHQGSDLIPSVDGKILPKREQKWRGYCVIGLVLLVAVLVVVVAVSVVQTSRRPTAATASSSTASPPPTSNLTTQSEQPPTLAPSSVVVKAMYEHLQPLLYDAFPDNSCASFAISGLSYVDPNRTKKYRVSSKTWMECNTTNRAAVLEEYVFDYVDQRPQLSVTVNGYWSVNMDYSTSTCLASVRNNTVNCTCVECETADGDFGLQAPCILRNDCVGISKLANPSRKEGNKT
jgi:hypothetical protein